MPEFIDVAAFALTYLYAPVSNLVFALIPRLA
jgi:hypothetical protein